MSIKNLAKEVKAEKDLEKLLKETELQLGDAAAEPIATPNEEPVVSAPEVEREDIVGDETQVEEVEEVITEEDETDLGDAAAEPIATPDEEPTTATPEVEREDIVGDDETQVEDIVEVVVEAARICKKRGIPATKLSLSKIIKEEFEISEPEEKQFDIDAVINTPEVAEIGTDEFEKNLEKEKEADPEKATADDVTVSEVKNYSSLKEALMLEEDYFISESYLKISPEEKRFKLIEQVALLLAKENKDTVFDRLLEVTIEAKRLQDLLVEKYNDIATERSALIVERQNR